MSWPIRAVMKNASVVRAGNGREICSPRMVKRVGDTVSGESAAALIVYQPGIFPALTD
jgi:hypothetical protein